MPESVKDRPTSSYEHVFLLAKNSRYFYDADAIAEATSESNGWAKQRAKGANTWDYNDTPERIAVTGQRVKGSTFGTLGKRNSRNVWTITPKPFKGAHFATKPIELAKPCITSKPGDTILDPFGGAGTTGFAAEGLGRGAILIELNPAYVELCHDRLS